MVPANVIDLASGCMQSLVIRISAVASMLGLAIWLGGLVALGAIAAPVVFSIVPLASSADAMTAVFLRFDTVAMSCAAVVLASEALQAGARVPFAAADHVRAAVSALAAALAVAESKVVSPRIAALHAAGAVRGVGSAGLELAQWHDMAERLGKGQLVLLVSVLTLRVLTLTRRRPLSGT
jgi:hypothetical protein